jgi:hypothetical protein
MTLGLQPERGTPSAADELPAAGEQPADDARLVEVAIDAAGAGGARPYT